MEQNNSHIVLFLEPIRKYLEDDSVSEILINGHSQIFVEQSGKLQKVDASFVSEASLKAAASNIAKSVGRILNDDNPRLDARLPDGSRVHAVIPPLSRKGTAIAIRKFKRDTLTIAKMLEYGSLDENIYKLIRACVLLHKNVIVSGGTSSGKTSVLNALSAFIANNERILVIETKKADKNGNGEVSIRDLIESSLRLRPDRLVIGEIRGGEAIDLLQALNTGHSGSMSTIHSNSALDCMYRMETCALLSGVEIPLMALRAQVASAIDVVIQTARLSDGSRKIIGVSEILPLVANEYRIQDLAVWKTTNISPEGKVIGQFEMLNEPTFSADARVAGIELPDFK